MERTFSIKYASKEVRLSDLDNDGDIELIFKSDEEENYIYLNKDDIVSLSKHLEYLIKKTKN